MFFEVRALITVQVRIIRALFQVYCVCYTYIIQNFNVKILRNQLCSKITIICVYCLECTYVRMFCNFTMLRVKKFFITQLRNKKLFQWQI